MFLSLGGLLMYFYSHPFGALAPGFVELIYALRCFYQSHVVVFPLFITLFLFSQECKKVTSRKKINFIR